MKILITGGAGFIGSAVIRRLIRETAEEVVKVDALTYVGNLNSLSEVAESPRCRFEHADICNRPAVERIFNRHQPDAVMRMAQDIRVDESI